MCRWVDVQVGGCAGGWMCGWVDVWVGGHAGGWTWGWGSRRRAEGGGVACQQSWGVQGGCAELEGMGQAKGMKEMATGRHEEGLKARGMRGHV